MGVGGSSCRHSDQGGADFEQRPDEGDTSVICQRSSLGGNRMSLDRRKNVDLSVLDAKEGDVQEQRRQECHIAEIGSCRAF